MRTDKEIKKELKADASKDPEKYYATDVLREFKFMRKKCSCGIYFWTTDKDRKVCGDSMCAGGFTFFKDMPWKNDMDYIQVWQNFAKMFRTLGYTPVDRYPTVARWNPTMDFTIASIAAFQPFVISGEVEPPENPLVIPQFCLRFGDIDNVGYTGSHMTGFVMIGQHMFVTPEKWDQDRCFRDIKKWLNDGLGIPDNELTFHEDAWAGGGNAGPCMEYFCRGLELGNQVYMLYEQTPDDELVDLKLKVLDMGMGHERNAWFCKQTNTMYEAVFPTVIKKLLSKTEVEYDDKFMKKYAPFAGKLNLDEVDDIDKAWSEVSKNVGMDTDELKEKVLPLAGIFSIAEHSRALLFVLNDGGLPSNVGGGYNLRVLIRRALSFIDMFNWKLRLADVCRWHADYLKPIFPELSNNLDEIEKILEVERSKYEATKQKTEGIVKKLLEKEEITEEKLIELYDSEGINPQLIKEAAAKQGKDINIPDDFFGKVHARHEQKEQIHATEREAKLDIDDMPETEALYYDDYLNTDFTGKVLKIIDNNVILDRSAFYPTSGGQLHDTGTLNGQEVIDVFKQGAVIVHVLNEKPMIKAGESVEGIINEDMRTQLAQHHTATHIVNAAAKRVLGKHINQAGAKKTMEKAHLDITHYQSVTPEELQKIEDEANRIVEEDLPIRKMFLPRREAEDKYGMGLYQGGAVPGKNIRVVEIPEVDVEACGGTHLNHTAETGKIKIIKSTKIQDGIVRLVFTAAKATEMLSKEEEGVLEQGAKLLSCEVDQVPGRVLELFTLWKKIVKKKKDVEFRLTSEERYEGDILVKSCEILRTQPEHLVKTINRFLGEIKQKQD